MVEAPERIWIWSDTIDEMGSSVNREEINGYVEYVRADLYAALETQLAEALKALEPFAAVAEHDIGEDESDNDLFRPLTLFNRVPRIRVRHLRVALAVVREAK